MNSQNGELLVKHPSYMCIISSAKIACRQLNYLFKNDKIWASFLHSCQIRSRLMLLYCQQAKMSLFTKKLSVFYAQIGDTMWDVCLKINSSRVIIFKYRYIIEVQKNVVYMENILSCQCKRHSYIFIYALNLIIKFRIWTLFYYYALCNFGGMCHVWCDITMAQK